MEKIINKVEFAKNLTLDKDDRLLRETGLKDVCGEYSNEAKEIVINHLVENNKEMLLKIARAVKSAQEK